MGENCKFYGHYSDPFTSEESISTCSSSKRLDEFFGKRERNIDRLEDLPFCISNDGQGCQYLRGAEEGLTETEQKSVSWKDFGAHI